MTFKGRNGTLYTPGREIGRGGEGGVFELVNAQDLVIKLYTELPQPAQVQKLHQMVNKQGEVQKQYAAWPLELVENAEGRVCGFVMKKLAGYVPLHMVFSPMDRKRLFPDRGYNFIVHVARNLAAAFYNLHKCGIVVGDVNEGNILVNGAGMVSFIDCDSFQVQGDGKYFYCEVGIPRYTAPELLVLRSFDKVVRTEQTDSFSMAVLLFQLLFLGRHPFAGRNKTNADIDEEAAIRMKAFAYSLTQQKKKLSPPENSLPITDLPDGIVQLFHKAFEQEERPLPAEWVRELDVLTDALTVCSQSVQHYYPAQAGRCPWCYFRQQHGIMYFLDDAGGASRQPDWDIERFVNGFKPEKLELKKWVSPPPPAKVVANAVDKYFVRRRLYRRLTIMILLIIIAVNIAIGFDEMIVLPVLVIMGYVYYLSPWARSITQKLKSQQEALHNMQQNLLGGVKDYNIAGSQANYVAARQKLDNMVQDFRKLPARLDVLKKEAEEQVYQQYLNDYLRQFLLSHHSIPSIGETKKAALEACGIFTAADIGRINTAVKVPGIGPKNLQVLLSWQREKASGFTYSPDTGFLQASLQRAQDSMEHEKYVLEHAIKTQFQAVNHLRSNIINRQNVLELQLKDAFARMYQARADMRAFQRFARW